MICVTRLSQKHPDDRPHRRRQDRISRRLAKLARAPFIKVEATKFTEVGYVGRDVEQIIRDLVDSAILQTREQMREEVKANAHAAAEERVIDRHRRGRGAREDHARDVPQEAEGRVSWTIP